MSVELDSVSRSFGATRAVAGVSLAVRTGELFAVLGPSGCGKSTLLRLIAGFERPDGGTVAVSGEAVAGPRRWIAPERRRVGMVFQEDALFPHLSVEGNVGFGVRGGGRSAARREERSAARRALELVGLHHKGDRYPHELSGGERQRVALARALATRPSVVLLDEPFSSLDAPLRASLRREVELILRDAEATALLVTHDQEEALSLADRVAVMRDGELTQVGPPEEVYARPADRWTAGFLGEVNVLAGLARGDRVETELGRFDLAPAEYAQPASAGGSVHMAVRPEQLELRADELGNAEVIDREFRGHDVLYRLRHEGGRTVLVQLPSLTLYEVGQRVLVRPARAALGTLVD